MISIIICSNRPTALSSLKKNIQETIGTPYELHVIDNSTNQFSIFSAYNQGVALSRFPYLCFIHEDILFRSKDWGQALCNQLEDETSGIIGVCGGSGLPKIPASWSFFENTKYFIQSNRSRDNRQIYEGEGFNDQGYKEVVALDGVFLSARKSLFEKIRFDETLYKGFHYYDIDTCLQAHVLGYQNRVVNTILIEHFSHGFRNRQWIENGLLFAKKWKEHLPVTLGSISEQDVHEKEYRFMTGLFVKIMVRNFFSDRAILKAVESCLSHLPEVHQQSFQRKMRRKIFWTRVSKKPLSLFFQNRD